MESLISLTSHWLTWAVWIILVGGSLASLHFLIKAEQEECFCEGLEFNDEDDWTEFMIEHQYECTK